MTNRRASLKKALIDPWLPRRPGSTNIQKYRDQFVISTLLSTFLFIVIATALNHFLFNFSASGKTLFGIFSVLTSVGTVSAMMILKLTGRRSLALNLFICTLGAALLLITLQSGGLHSPANPSAIIFPVLATMGISARAGLIWTLLIFITGCLLFYADLQGIHFDNFITQENLGFAVFSGLFTANSFIIFIIIYSDISLRTLRIRFEEEHNRYIHLALHDSLTGIANRRHFINEIERAIFNAKLVGTPFSVLFFDLNHFKKINDSVGHHIGDGVLIEFAKRLRENTRASDIVARLGGDEFSILLLGLNDIDVITQKISSYAATLLPPIHIENEEYQISASIGYAIYPRHGSDYESLLKAADQNMYAAKRSFQPS